MANSFFVHHEKVYNLQMKNINKNIIQTTVWFLGKQKEKL